MGEQPALLPEDGAKLFGQIDEVEPSVFRALCHAELDCKSHHLSEEAQYFMTDSYQKAYDWISGVAAARGFRSWFDMSEAAHA